MDTNGCRHRARPWRAALIGCGAMGYSYGAGPGGGLSHFSALRSADGFELVAVADSDEATAGRVQAEQGTPALTDWRLLAQRFEPDLFVVATPDATHYSILRELVSFKPRLVFCEKPLALELGQVRELTALYRQCGVPLALNYSRRYLAGFQRLGEGLASGHWGRAQSLTIYYSRGLRHNASHYLDLLLWWFGPPQQWQVGRVRPGLTESDPTLSLRMDYDAGPEVHLIGLDSSECIVNELDLVCDTRRVRMDTLGRVLESEPRPHPELPGFSYYIEVKEWSLDLASALPRAYRNLAGFLDGRQQLLCPAEHSEPLHELLDSFLECIA